jgi:hypothetical protein
MLITALIFYTAIFGLVLMVYLKARRLKLDMRSRWSHLSERVDGKIRRGFAQVMTFLSYFNRKSAAALLEWSAYHALSRIRKAYLWIHQKAHAHPKSKKIIDMVRGKGEVENMGGASLYLKRISRETAPQTQTVK